MKKVLRFALMLAMVAAVLVPATAGAQGGLTYTSGVQILNMSSTNAATVRLLYYNPNGTLAGQLDPPAIAAGKSANFYPLTGVATGFKGSMVVTSDQQVVAIANLVTTGMGYTASTTSFSGGDTTFNLPLVMCNNNGFNTFFSVQNAGTADANITITYLRGSFGVNGLTETATIKPGASAYFDQQAGSTTRNCGTLAGTDGRFIGSAKITSNQPVVATLMQLNTTNYKIMMGYNGFPGGGSATLMLPLVMANNSGYYTGMQIQNAGTVATTVVVDYTPNTAGTYQPPNDTATCLTNLAPGQSCNLIQKGGTWDGKGRYVGAAVVTNSASQPLVAIVNQAFPGSAAEGPFGTAYESFNPAVASANVSAPIIMSNNGGFYTSIQIMNTGAGNCAAVHVNYTTTLVSGGNQPTNETFSLNALSSKTIIQNATPPGNGSANNWNNIGRYLGGAEVSAPGCTIIAIVNQIKRNVFTDTFMTYDTFNH